MRAWENPPLSRGRRYLSVLSGYGTGSVRGNGPLETKGENMQLLFASVTPLVNAAVASGYTPDAVNKNGVTAHRGRHSISISRKGDDFEVSDNLTAVVVHRARDLKVALMTLLEIDRDIKAVTF